MRNNIIYFILISLFFVSCASQRQLSNRKKNLILSYAKTYLGTPYQYGGMSRKGIDCSALIYLCYNQAGIKMPRTAKEQTKVGKTKKMKNIKSCDLVFFKLKKDGKKWLHAGIITRVTNKDVRFIHASYSKGVVESNLLQPYYFDNIKVLKGFF